MGRKRGKKAKQKKKNKATRKGAHSPGGKCPQPRFQPADQLLFSFCGTTPQSHPVLLPHVKQRLKIPFLIQNIPGETPARARHLQQLCMLLQPHSPCAAPHLSQLSLFSPPFPPRATGSTQFPLLTQTVPLRQITSHNNFQATDGIAVTIRALLSQRREPKTRCSLLPGRDP